MTAMPHAAEQRKHIATTALKTHKRWPPYCKCNITALSPPAPPAAWPIREITCVVVVLSQHINFIVSFASRSVAATAAFRHRARAKFTKVARDATLLLSANIKISYLLRGLFRMCRSISWPRRSMVCWGVGGSGGRCNLANAYQALKWRQRWHASSAECLIILFAVMMRCECCTSRAAWVSLLNGRN